MTGYGVRAAGAVLLGAVIAGPALASGYIPAIEDRVPQASYAACLAKLEAAAKEDQAQVSPRTFAADGSTRQVTVEPISKGVEKTGRKKARYQAKVWYTNGAPRADLGKMVYRASWQETNLTCEGKVLVSNASQGFTSEGYGPLESPPAEAVKP